MLMAAAVVVVALLTPGARVDGAGARVDDVRTIPGQPDRVVVRGALRIEIVEIVEVLEVVDSVQSAEASAATGGAVRVTVSAEANLQPMVLATSTDGVLHLTVTGEPISVDGIVVKVQMRAPTSIVAAGSSSVSTPLRGQARAEVSGAARVQLRGAPESLHVVGRGAGFVDAIHVVVERTTVEIGGASEVEIGPAQALSVTGSGVGRVRYRGDPVLRTTVTPTVKVTRFRS